MNKAGRGGKRSVSVERDKKNKWRGVRVLVRI
jgi:hypothetical protein